MKIVNVHEAKTHLSRHVDEAARSEPFVIARAGKPLVRVAPLEAAAAPEKRRLDLLAGQLSVPDDFDTMGQEQIIRTFEGE